ncbi:MAG TPA: FAD-dependent oxidoreductase [Kofleriaceae bacterium]|nr:FAD-dependent oxidoreductase [Kofleriaceae bacterium]
MSYDVLVVGAGPTGLATAIEAQRCGLRVVVIDRGGIAAHIQRYPIGMPFYTPRWTLELAGLPLDTARRHPTREDALSYYTRVARLTALEVRTGCALGAVTGRDGEFTVTVGANGDVIRTRKIVLATGVFGQPRRLDGVPGVELPKVSYGYQEPHAMFGLDVAIVGAGNSAAEAALRFVHAGARVTVINRAPTITENRWRWYVQDVEALVAAGEIRLIHHARVQRIEPARLIVQTERGELELPNDRVVLLLGFEPARELFDRLQLAYEPDTLTPRFEPRSLESSVPGIFLAGIVMAGRSPDLVFIQGARYHGKAIIARITGQPPPPIEDRGLAPRAYWKQFEDIEVQLDHELALDLVPVVVGELRDDIVDVHVYQALKAGHPLNGVYALPGTVLDSTEGWLFKREHEDAGVFKGRRLTGDTLDLLRRADGTRRIRDIVDELAPEVAVPRDELRGMIVETFLALLRAGTITWKATRLIAGATSTTAARG